MVEQPSEKTLRILDEVGFWAMALCAALFFIDLETQGPGWDHVQRIPCALLAGLALLCFSYTIRMQRKDDWIQLIFMLELLVVLTCVVLKSEGILVGHL